MNRRVTISVPDDVADQIATLPPRQVSAYVSEAMRRGRASQEIRATLVAAGHRDFPYEPEAAAQRLGERRIDHETRRRAITRLAETTGRPVAEVQAEFDRRAKG